MLLTEVESIMLMESSVALLAVSTDIVLDGDTSHELNMSSRV
jgi:hypothetical protein